MIKIFGAGRGKRADKKDGEDDKAPGAQTGRKQAFEIRLQKEMDELELPSQVQMDLGNAKSLAEFVLNISPDEGFWKGAQYVFKFRIPSAYPHEPPKVKCETQVYHPNIDTEGNICLNILREDWKPVLSISSIIYGLLYLFLEPNPSDPLNHDAAKHLRNNRKDFATKVIRTLQGGCIDGFNYPTLVSRNSGYRY